MNACSWQDEIARYFDGEHPDAARVEAHLAECPACRAELAGLRQVRALLPPAPSAISDAQFPLFMEGIREKLDAPRAYRWRTVWPALSFAAAALVVAVSAFLILGGGPQPALANEVESVSTELSGATVNVYENDDGVTTVWINVTKDTIP